jgi:hypothetical protein
MQGREEPFNDLPAALVDEVIGKAGRAGGKLLSAFQSLRTGRVELRSQLENRNLIRHESQFGCPPAPTTCATDGSYAIERMLSADFAAAAAVAVEGLTPPSERRHWQAPYHSTFVEVEKHNSETATVLRAVMMGRELMLAAQAPHDVVMLDSTLTLPIIYFNQALNCSLDDGDLACLREFRSHARDYLNAYLMILECHRSDKNYVALPKYSSRREVGVAVGWLGEHDDRGLLTLLLNPGELTDPLALERPESPWHINVASLARTGNQEDLVELANQIVSGVECVKTFYYKPHAWLPALRIEVSDAVATNRHRLATVLQALKFQCATGSMLEPYPLYLADRTVKALARAIPTFRQVATQSIVEKYDGDVSEVFFAMHGYRSESGGK